MIQIGIFTTNKPHRIHDAIINAFGKFSLSMKSSSGELIYSNKLVYIRLRCLSSLDALEKCRAMRFHIIYADNEFYSKSRLTQHLLHMVTGHGNNLYTIETLLKYLNGETKTMYDYRRAMIGDIKNWIINTNWVYKNYNPDYYQMLDTLYEELWDKDEITGNGGNYYSTYDNCLTYVSENLQLFMEAYTALKLGDQGEWKDNVPQRADCAIRCYLLRDCLEEACNEL